MDTADNAIALLLIAHGSREPSANADLARLAAELRRNGPYSVVEPAYLELAQATIDEGAARCVEQGARRVILVPYFLSAGVHVRRDLTAARERLATRYPGVEFRLAEALGPHPKLAEVVLERAASLTALNCISPKGAVDNSQGREPLEHRPDKS